MKTISTYILFLLLGLGLQAQNTILNEDFETDTFPPQGWISYRGIDDIGPANDWIPTTQSHTGNSAAFSRFSDNAIGVAEDWLVTPLIDLSSVTESELRFFSKETYGTFYASQYDVRVSTSSQTDHSSFTTVASYNDFNDSTYEEFVIDLSTYDGQQIYIAFVHIDEFEDNWFLDDITLLGINPDCNISNTPMSPSPNGIANPTNNLMVGQSFTPLCSGTLNYIEISLSSGNIPAGNLDFYAGNTISGTPVYSQSLPSIENWPGGLLRINLTNDFEVDANSTYTFHTGVGNLVIAVYLQDTYSGGNAYVSNISYQERDLFFNVNITENLLHSSEIENLDSLFIFPNPVLSNLSIPNLNTSEIYKIYNLLGKEVGSGIITQRSQISVSYLEKGIYFLKINSYDTLKFIKN
ncbi:T9SS-dependent choice-of-anchor J family protein [Psychroserpens algicola]|uniref:T9SS-dependent choice-of-anchor J family protein n=1 Tax=Psychroserpens algicola TaxID=1719034 RepID=UPI0019546190|nr:choice-of-anchor J domain-containing protein [Psychroserpens algicola]